MTKNQSVYRQGRPLPVNTFLHACFLLLVLGAVSSCKKDKKTDVVTPEEPAYQLELPRGFPKPDIPEDNQFTQDRIELGRQLFFDPVMSRDSTISCGSCHQTNKHFTDHLALSTGIEGRVGTRNAPSIVNMAYAPYLFWDGGNPTLEQQVLAPIDNHNELDYDVNLIVARLLRHSTYPAQFQKAYSQPPNVYTLTRAIACYERSLIMGNSRYDDYLQNSNQSALTSSEKSGMAIFMGERGECFHCHGGFNFTDNSFQNNGIYSTYADSGRMRITGRLQDYGKFKVPSLRNVEKTAPYMHDGSLATLEDVVDHYNSGGHPSITKSIFIQSIGLTQQEKQDLVNFLRSLSEKS